MLTVVRIAALKHSTVSVEFSDGSTVVLFRGVVHDLQWVVGKTIGANEQQTAKDRSALYLAKKKAYTFAQYKPRTVDQVRTYLMKHAHDEHTIQHCIQWLLQFALLGDEQYCYNVVEASKSRKPLSPLQLTALLRKKGIPANLVQEVLNTRLPEDAQVDGAASLARKKLRTIKTTSSVERERCLYQFLQRKGYSPAVIGKALRMLVFVVTLVVIGHVCGAQTLQMDEPCSKTRLPESINKYQPTTMPVQGTNGLMYLDRKLHPNNREGLLDADDVWVAYDSAGATIVAQQPMVKGAQPDVVFGLTPDKRSAIVACQYTPDSGDALRCFALLHRADTLGIFTIIEPITIPGISHIGKHYFAAISPDKHRVVVSLDLPGGKGGLDLYQSVRTPQGWSPLQPLVVLNSVGIEGSPCIASDNQTLYFTSNTREGRRGKSDIFLTRATNAEWTTFTTPQNIGWCINTQEDETTISVDAQGSTALITSWDSASARAGIYRVVLPLSMRPLPTAIVTVRVVDEASNMMLPGATIRVTHTLPRGSDSVLITRIDSGSHAQFLLHQQTTYTIETFAEGYARHKQQLTVRTLDSATTLRVLVPMISSVTPGASVFFAKGSDVLTPDGVTSLRRFADTSRLRSVRFRVVGYTDATGLRAWNTTLAAKRAQAVKNAMIELGFSIEMLVSEGRGIEFPGMDPGMADNPQSRRVDVFVQSVGLP
jgi:SOS response regulatory protein OraA/RecX/outer membrane protein OmpA-like peptidoglycan-associated protein